eukprot:TRINITY_DN3439_c0_g2_i1.p1 TRINITY_DN3439_c0_g2~~TRINITY_DN3439_c0_g2_i1.p1  ORF type:complete len:149 (-),score=33.59 TRINITY_DN3439_c0_g2_i1:24-470(-)
MYNACLSVPKTRKSAFTTLSSGSFHTSAVVENFPQNQAKRKQVRKMFRTAAKNHGINPNMSNGSIKKALQIAGHMQVAPEQLLKWELETIVSPQERYERRQQMRGYIETLENKYSPVDPVSWSEVAEATKERMLEIEAELASRKTETE